MREKNKKILYSILIIFIMIILKNATAKAATTSLSANNTEPTEGQSVTVTASVNAGAWNLSFSGAGKSETIYGYTQTNANSSDSKSITFTAGSAGTTYTFSLTGDMTDIASNTSEPVNKSITIKVKSNSSTSNGSSSSGNNANSGSSNNGGTSNNSTTSTKSSNANVKMITTSPVDFSGFKASKTSGYEVTVENEVDKINVNVDKEDSNASVSLLNKTNSDTGKSWVYIAEGNNEIAVTVTSEDGKNQKTYTINVTRKVKEDETEEPEESEENSEEEPMEEVFGLTELNIEGLELKPQFQTDVYEYNVELKEDLEKLNITTLTTKVNSEIEITGNENLQEGENIITIIVKGENEAETVAYQIIVNKTLEKQEVTSNAEQEQQEKMKKIIILSVVGGVILVIVIAVIIVKIKKSKESDEGYIPYENLVDDYEDDDYIENNAYKENDEIEEQNEDTEDEFYEEEPKKKKRSKGKRFK